MSAVQFSATLNTAQLQSALTASNQQVGAWARGVEGQVSGVDSAMNKLGAGLAVYFGAGKLKEFGMEVINVRGQFQPVSYTHLRAHETDSYLVCRLLLEK